ncbi:MAG: hypothetical protein LBO04_03695 [Spirochaetaceae bacterium]|jgi:transposase-like protein|nr:hypothetical protein [Spirochaetaceae bacterium]
MGKKDKERRVYPREFKVEAAAPAEKHEKPVRLIAADLGINGNMPRRWMAGTGFWRHRPAAFKRTRTAAGRGTGPPAERSEGAEGGGVKLRFTGNPKKSGRTSVRVIFAQGEPR